MKSLSTLFGKAYGGISRPVWWLSLTLLINRSGTMVIFFMSVYLSQELHFNLQRVGVVMAMFGAGSLLGVFVGGRLIDRIGYYPVMLWSLVSGGILFLIVGQLHDYLLLCIGVFVLSAFGEAFRPANMAAVSYYSTAATYTRSISLNRLAINLGFSIGPAIGGFLAAHNYKLIFWVDGFTCLAAAAMVLLFLENKHDRTIPQSKADTAKPGSSPYADRIYLLFLPLAVLFAIAFFQFFSVMPLYYKQVQHLSEKYIGALMALNGLLVAGIEMILIYKIEKRWSLYNFIALGAFLLIISYLALFLANGFWWLALVTVVISFSEMFAMPFMNTFMNSRSEANKGQYASLYVMAWSAAQILTPIISTQIIAHSGYRTLWVVLAFFALLVVAGIKMLEKFSKNEAAVPVK